MASFYSRATHIGLLHTICRRRAAWRRCGRFRVVCSLCRGLPYRTLLCCGQRVAVRPTAGFARCRHRNERPVGRGNHHDPRPSSGTYFSERNAYLNFRIPPTPRKAECTGRSVNPSSRLRCARTRYNRKIKLGLKGRDTGRRPSRLRCRCMRRVPYFVIRIETPSQSRNAVSETPFQAP